MSQTHSGPDLQARVAELEAGAKFDATKDAVQAVEIEFLAKLREIQAVMASAGNGGGNSKEMEALKQENETLKKKNAKLEYRIQHILENFEKVYSETRASKQSAET